MRMLWACALTVVILPLAACGNSNDNMTDTAAATVTITEKVGPPDRYTFSPTTVQLDKGKSLAIENKTDEDHSLKCTPDAGIGTVKIDKNEMKSAKFSTAGTFTCSSEEHADATVTVTVTVK